MNSNGALSSLSTHERGCARRAVLPQRNFLVLSTAERSFETARRAHHRSCVDFVSLHIITSLEDNKEEKVKLKTNSNKILGFEVILKSTTRVVSVHFMSCKSFKVMF